MKKLIILVFVLAACSERLPRQLNVAWEVTYSNNVRERIMAHQDSKLTEAGCFTDRRNTLRCDVRSARRIPLHQVEKDGVMYELD